MIRIVLTQILLFLLPFLCYALYLRLTKKESRRYWIDAPRYWLVVAGFVCSLIGFGVLALINNNPTGGVYVPAHYENGKLIPGQIKPLDASEPDGAPSTAPPANN